LVEKNITTVQLATRTPQRPSSGIFRISPVKLIVCAIALKREGRRDYNSIVYGEILVTGNERRMFHMWRSVHEAVKC